MRHYTQKYHFPSKSAKQNLKKKILFESIYKNRFFLRKLTKMFKLIKIPKTFICVRIWQVTFFI